MNLTPDQQAELLHVIILLIVALTAAINVWIAGKQANQPTSQDHQKLVAKVDKIQATVNGKTDEQDFTPM